VFSVTSGPNTGPYLDESKCFDRQRFKITDFSGHDVATAWRIPTRQKFAAAAAKPMVADRVVTTAFKATSR
jgi:hypothetical protein